METQQKTHHKKTEALCEVLSQKTLFFRKKWLSARKHENRASAFGEMMFYDGLYGRALALEHSQWRRIAGFRSRMSVVDYERRLSEKAEKKQRFLNDPKFSMWFFSGSLGADYGSFQCEKCSRTFYHSPATITIGKETKYVCCCGHCTNEIIGKYYGERHEPYQ